MGNGSKPMEMVESGSIKDWEHSPNLTPRGFEIKKDELYVLNGDTLIKAYHLLMNQRASSLMMLAKLPPTSIAQYEEYLSVSKHINLTMYHILHSVPLPHILQMQEEARIEAEEKKNAENRKHGLTLKEIMSRFHLSEGDRDELKLPPPNGDGKTE